MLNWLEPYWLAALSVLATAVGLGFLLFIHEFGHFFVAKRAGVKVEVFSLGICHFLLSWTWKGTVYALSWMPLGGYVRMSGQQDLAPPPGHKPLPHEYGAKKVWARMAIIVAGVTMNFIAGYLCFAGAFVWGRDSVPAVVSDMRMDLPCYQRAHAKGLREGDTVLAVDGDPIYSFSNLKMRVARIKPGTDVTFRVRHVKAEAGRPLEEDVVIRTFEGAGRGLSLTPISPSLEHLPTVSVPLCLGFEGEKRLMVSPEPEQLADFPEWQKAFRPGDSVMSVNGQPCRTERDFSKAVEKALAAPADACTCGDAGQDGEGGGPGCSGCAPAKPEEDVTTGTVTLQIKGIDGIVRPMSMPVKSVYRMGILFAGAGKKRKPVADRPLRVVAIDKESVVGEKGIDLGDDLFLDRSLKPCTFEEFGKAVRASGGKPFKVVVRSAYDGTVREDVEVVAKRYWQPALGGEERGIPWGAMLLVTGVSPGSQAEAKGLKAGAVIASISVRADHQKPGTVASDVPATLEWVYQGKAYGPHRVMAFSGSQAIEWTIPRQEWLQLKAGESLKAGWRETAETLRSTTVILKRLSNREIGAEAVSGPVGIVHAAYRMAQEGLGQLLWLLGLMGVSLAFFNLLPIPVLDGGHLVFLVYEAIFRRPPSPRVVEIAQYAGLLIIASLFILVFWNDISRLIRVG
ncbi:MAG TPA: site-2 protease family protein [Planctomycetota bacterium]|nr:site-2 protease family protein [Planctomycetota bacterium]